MHLYTCMHYIYALMHFTYAPKTVIQMYEPCTYHSKMSSSHRVHTKILRNCWTTVIEQKLVANSSQMALQNYLPPAEDILTDIEHWGIRHALKQILNDIGAETLEGSSEAPTGWSSRPASSQISSVVAGNADTACWTECGQNYSRQTWTMIQSTISKDFCKCSTRGGHLLTRVTHLHVYYCFWCIYACIYYKIIFVLSLNNLRSPFLICVLWLKTL